MVIIVAIILSVFATLIFSRSSSALFVFDPRSVYTRPIIPITKETKGTKKQQDKAPVQIFATDHARSPMCREGFLVCFWED